MVDCTVKQGTPNTNVQWYSYLGTPQSSLGQNGDLFISKTSPFYLYQKINGTWVSFGYAKGADGSSGSDIILLNDFTHTPSIGSFTNAEIFSYDINVADLISNGDYINVYAIASVANSDVAPVEFRWTIDSVTMGVTPSVYNIGQSLYYFWDIDINRIALNGASNIFIKHNVSGTYGGAETFDNKSITTASIDLTAPATVPLKLLSSAANGTVTPFQLLIKKYKVI